MADFLGNAGSPQLLFLLGFTLVGVLFFAAVIIITVSRRRKKTKMKLGSEPRSALDLPPPAPDLADDLNTSLLAPHAPSSNHVTEAVQPPSPPSQSDLSLEILSRNQQTQASPASAKEEAIPLATRHEKMFSPAPAQPPEPAELLRLLRHPQTGQLIVEVAGQRYTRLTDVTDKHMGQYILKLVTHMLAFTSGMIGLDSGVKTVFNPKVGKTPPPIETSQALATSAPVTSPSRPTSTDVSNETDPVPKPTPEAEAAFLASLQAQPRQPERPLSSGLLGRSGSTSSPAPSILPGLNLADEINKIVQARLLASPLAANTEVEITSDPGGGIRIKVNDVIYSSPDEITDAEVRQLIKASIKQWERS